MHVSRKVQTKNNFRKTYGGGLARPPVGPIRGLTRGKTAVFFKYTASQPAEW